MDLIIPCMVNNAILMGPTSDIKDTKHWHCGFSSSNMQDSLPCKNGSDVRMYKGNFGTCLKEYLVGCQEKAILNDEAGANFASIKEIFGEDLSHWRVFTCQ